MTLFLIIVMLVCLILLLAFGAVCVLVGGGLSFVLALVLTLVRSIRQVMSDDGDDDGRTARRPRVAASR